LNDLQMTIAALGDDCAPDNACVDDSVPSLGKNRPKPGKIGEGRKNPLSKSQRKHALYVVTLLQWSSIILPSNSVVEQLRQPLILSNPEFSSNPFQTLRTHAQNSLSKHYTSS
jgi:hypothetical protein